MSKEKDEDNQSIENSDQWPQGEDADAMMECLMGNYLMQNEIVRAKLYHAQQATNKSMRKLEKLLDETKPDAAIKELQKIKELEGLWGQLVGLLSQIGLGEEDIANIEKAVTSTPKAIREYYDVLVEQDRNLSNLIYEMEWDVFADAYDQAKETREEIQSQPNPMSGLGPEEYEPAPEEIQSKSGFEIITLPNFREDR